jgi:type I restriction-modification system DNA methylase subunit
MIFTACALVAKRYGSVLIKGMDYTTFHTSIHATLAKSFDEARKQNLKLNILLEAYSSIKMNITEKQTAIDDFIECVEDISDNINSDFWNGEDVMAIFFNEFNRYKGKSESGQVFTPDHITSLMYEIIGINKDDIILDAACGSGAFLVKAMCNMIKEAGGNSTDKAKEIKQNQLFGIEFDKEIYALACANMLIHKDGKTNLEQLDSRTDEAKKWIKSKRITKVLMNPPFENKYGCIEIVGNVLESVDRDTICAFIMPDNKLETNLNKTKKILQKHTLSKIIKLPHEIYSGTTTSVFIFRSGIPQNNNKIFACAILDDGLETIKNQGRQDIKKQMGRN